MRSAHLPAGVLQLASPPCAANDNGVLRLPRLVLTSRPARLARRPRPADTIYLVAPERRIERGGLSRVLSPGAFAIALELAGTLAAIAGEARV